jgi:hypothetical protein
MDVHDQLTILLMGPHNAMKSAARNFNKQQHIRKASDKYHRLYITVIFSSVILGCLILRAGFCSLKLRAADSLPHTMNNNRLLV